LLLQNHGPVTGVADLNQTMDLLEEIEHSAQILLLLEGIPR